VRTLTRSPQQRVRRAALAAAAAGAELRPAVPWLPPSGADSQLQRAGVVWDAVRAPAYLGDRALAQLGDGQGAVIRDGYRHFLYWLVPLATAAGWSRIAQVEVFGPTCWVEVPPAGRTHGLRLYWARFPTKPTGQLLTEPDALHAALVAAARAADSPYAGRVS
jgi:hypothetical protein